MQPIYRPGNTKPAFQLNWSLALYGKTRLPPTVAWLESLTEATEADGVRVLSIDTRSKNVVQFLISSRPSVSPSNLVRSVKGRFQYAIREQFPKAFRRNYHIQSVGATKSTVLDEYVAAQPQKHTMADPNVQARIEAIQFHDASIDLSKTSTGTYGRFLNSLQIVLENAEGWHEVRDENLRGVRNIIVAAARKKSWRISRIGLLSNHVHVLLGAAVTESPGSIALSLMNNIAYVNEMKPVLKHSFYAGTFGSYDRGVVRLSAHQVVGSAGTSPDGGPGVISRSG